MNTLESAGTPTRNLAVVEATKARALVGDSAPERSLTETMCSTAHGTQAFTSEAEISTIGMLTLYGTLGISTRRHPRVRRAA